MLSAWRMPRVVTMDSTSAIADSRMTVVAEPSRIRIIVTSGSTTAGDVPARMQPIRIASIASM